MFTIRLLSDSALPHRATSVTLHLNTKITSNLIKNRIKARSWCPLEVLKLTKARGNSTNLKN